MQEAGACVCSDKQGHHSWEFNGASTQEPSKALKLHGARAALDMTAEGSNEGRSPTLLDAGSSGTCKEAALASEVALDTNAEGSSGRHTATRSAALLDAGSIAGAMRFLFLLSLPHRSVCARAAPSSSAAPTSNAAPASNATGCSLEHGSSWHPWGCYSTAALPKEGSSKATVFLSCHCTAAAPRTIGKRLLHNAAATAHAQLPT